VRKRRRPAPVGITGKDAVVGGRFGLIEFSEAASLPRSLRYVTPSRLRINRHSKNECRKKPGHSGRDDSEGQRRKKAARQCLGVRALHYAEEVAVGIFEDDEIVAWSIAPGVARRASFYEALDLGVSVFCIEVEVQSTSFA
jgi:hypothetical protein